MKQGNDPVRWWVIDNWCEPLDWPVPPREWPGWEARYENDCERGKRTTRRIERMLGKDLDSLTGRDDAWSHVLGYPVFDDPTLHGGGLHVMEPGAWLNTHLDYDRHPIINFRRRALNLILFLHPRWQSEWGGGFYLADPLGNPVVTIEPRPGRLIAFEVGDLSYHGVQPVTGPAERVSLAAYYLSAAAEHNTRMKALFLPRR